MVLTKLNISKTSKNKMKIILPNLAKVSASEEETSDFNSENILSMLIFDNDYNLVVFVLAQRESIAFCKISSKIFY